jgi:hypothetical protein
VTTTHQQQSATTRSAVRRPPPAVVRLTDDRAVSPDLTGAKAAALARAAAVGPAVVPGVVVTTTAVGELAGRPDGAFLPAEIEDAWRALSDGGSTPVVVRSSSTVEDLGTSSMAGRFASVVGVVGAEAFRDAVREVIASRSSAAEGSSELTGEEPLAVLVQPLLDAACGGVLFGIDPVSGREDRLVVAAVEGGPDRLVSGDVDGSRYELARDGPAVEQSHGEGGIRLDRRRLRELARLGDAHRRGLRRPAGRRVGLRPRRSPAPAAEPARHRPAARGAGRSRARPRSGRRDPAGATAPARGRPVGAAAAGGPAQRAAARRRRQRRRARRLPRRRRGRGAGRVDLDLLEGTERAPTVAERLDPRPRQRRLRASWRVGRLRAALPALGRDLLDRADEALAGVPDLARLSDRQLVALLHRCAPALRSVPPTRPWSDCSSRRRRRG